MNHCRSAPLRGIGTIHNPHTTQRITDRKQVVWRVVDHKCKQLFLHKKLWVYFFLWKMIIWCIFLLRCCSLHHLVYQEEEEEAGHHTPLLSSCLYFEPLHCFPFLYDYTLESFIYSFNHSDNLWWYTITLYDIPQLSLFTESNPSSKFINGNTVYWWSPFIGLL